MHHITGRRKLEMKTTAHYELNQWELEDRVLMEDFNRDNAKLDAAVAAAMAKAVSEGQRLDGALSTAKSQLQSSINTNKTQLQNKIDAVKQELQGALNTSQTQLQGALDTADSRLTASLNALKVSLEAEDRRLDGAKLEIVTALSKVVPAASSSPRHVDISSVAFGDFLLFAICLEGIASAQINLNSSKDAWFSMPGSSSSASGALGSLNNLGRGAFLFFPLKNPDAYVACRQIEGGFTSGYAKLAYKDIRTLDLTGPAGSTPKLTILGVR